MLIAFNKPYGVLSQFTADGSANRTLADFHFPPRVYPLGRLDADSEGLLLLSDERSLNKRLLDPVAQHPREYWVQVERIPSVEALAKVASGVQIQGRVSLPAQVTVMDPQPEIPARTPPIRFRKTVPTCWISIVLIEGRNRQVRRMFAAAGHPVLRLVRVRIGQYHLPAVSPGQWIPLRLEDRSLIFQRQNS